MAARFFGGLAQLGEHLPCKQGVESSNLLVSTIIMKRAVAASRRHAQHELAQMLGMEEGSERIFEEYP